MNRAFVIVLLICLLVLVRCFWKRWIGAEKQGDGRQMPGPPGTPVLGHLMEVLRPDFHRILTAWSVEYGGVYRITILGLAGVVVSEPGAVARVLGRDSLAREIPKHLSSYKQLNLLWGSEQQYSIFTGLSTDRWRLVRKAVSPCFSTQNIRDKFETVIEKCIALGNSIQMRCSEGPVDVDDAGLRLTLDIVSKAAFNFDTKAVEFQDNRVIAGLPCALKELQKRMTNPFQAFLKTQASREAMRCAKEFRAVCKEILISMRTSDLPSNGHCSVGSELLKIRDPITGRPLSDAQMVAEIGTFLMGGFETTAHTLSFTLFCIANFAGVQDKIAAELEALGLLSKQGNREVRRLQYDDLQHLNYLETVMKESMRMFPVVAGFPRLTDQDTDIGTYRVKRGTLVYVLFHSMHNSPAYWDDPCAFQPERWGECGAQYARPTALASTAAKEITGAHVSEKNKERHKRFLPFSDGPRSCVAQGMALMELKTALAVLCAQFCFQPAAGTGGVDGIRSAEVMALTLHVSGGIHLHCIPRKIESVSVNK